MANTNELLEQILGTRISKVVSCPAEPREIPGMTPAAIYAAGDAFGTVIELVVPKSGIIYSATFWDLDDEALQTDLELFKRKIATTADNATWAPTDQDILYFVTELAFFSFDDHGTSQTSELVNIGKAYSAPEGRLWIQAISRGAPTIAAGNIPKIQLQILSDDPNFQEV